MFRPVRSMVIKQRRKRVLASWGRLMTQAVPLQTKPPPDARIIKRREQEDRLSKIQNAVQVRDQLQQQLITRISLLRAFMPHCCC
jgi:hypothetical protein